MGAKVPNAMRARKRGRMQDQAARAPKPRASTGSSWLGYHTGVVTIGLMGSERHIYNFTVFGRDVNLAARLEGLSGRGRILIGEGTFKEIQRDDPALGATCRELEPAHVKGFRTPVKVYEVPWQAGTPEPLTAPPRTVSVPLTDSPPSAAP